MKTKLIASVVALCLTVAGGGVSWAVTVDWSDAYLFQSGFDNPLVLVGFNPQPEPPATVYHPPEPGKSSSPGFSVETTGSDFQILFAISDSMPLSIDTSNSTLVNGHYEFDVLGSSASSTALTPVYKVLFDMGAGDGGFPDPLSWYGFNPQPEPPALGPGFAAMGFGVSFPALTSADFSFQIYDVANQSYYSLEYSPVPEPSSILLFCTGLAGFGIWRKKKS